MHRWLPVTALTTRSDTVRKPLIAGNWKMNCTTTEARELARGVVDKTTDLTDRVDVTLAPPFTSLAVVAAVTKGTAVSVAAQDMHWADKGAFTGEISPLMVAELASQVILGHSERRTLFHETDQDVNRKVHAALAHGLTPILCVGETLEQREAEQTDLVVTVQLADALEGISAGEASSLIVAYEPVWAIGSGLPCDDAEAGRVCTLIRSQLAEAFGPAAADSARVLYGGSVKPGNFGAYLHHEDIDGALVGGASLEADSFNALVRTAAEQ